MKVLGFSVAKKYLLEKRENYKNVEVIRTHLKLIFIINTLIFYRHG